MSLTEAEGLVVGEGAQGRRLALLRRAGAGPCVVWLGGFRSDMRATKAEAIDRWGAEHGRAVLRFDYSGHGESGGCFEEGTIGRWLADSLAAIATAAPMPVILVGSSMGGWLALLAAKRLAAQGRPPVGLVLVAPAVDFTEALMWPSFDDATRAAIQRDGIVHLPSQYGPPMPITRALIEEAREHLMLGGLVAAQAPVHVLQGMADTAVPWRHAMALVERIADDPVTVTLIKDGDHRLSRPEDVARLLAAIEGIAAG